VDIAIAIGDEPANALAAGVLNAVRGVLGDHLDGARQSLASARHQFAFGDRVYAFTALGVTEMNLFSLGDLETAFTLGAWAAYHSDGIPDMDRSAAFGGDAARHFVHQLTGEPYEHRVAVVASMSEDDVLGLAQDELDQLGASTDDEPIATTVGG
jgi:hypothetical protein